MIVMFKHLLVPLDGSKLAEAALPAAISLATQYGSEVSLFQVTHTPYLSAMAQGDTYTELTNNLRKMAHNEAMSYLQVLQAGLKRQGVDARIYVEEGDQVADVLLRAVQALEVDTIVMSTHGRGGIQRWLFGSVADRLLRQANIPVLLIRAAEVRNEAA